jgi:hypothetical protein
LIDMHHVLVRKQERECARLDEFDFARRARTVRKVAEWVRERCADPARLNVMEMVGRITMMDDWTIFAALRAHLAQPILDDDWHRLVGGFAAIAETQLIEERGDPRPHRMA